MPSGAATLFAMINCCTASFPFNGGEKQGTTPSGNPPYFDSSGRIIDSSSEQRTAMAHETRRHSRPS
ncbi:protein of unknown function [Candidatus Filomicrobium marinum]|uniref:Uncharacterized protein n=1 Tax=Candidatus Filomicrobium marinum TaxID=1608628 RepID=A0A0D6JJE3_9HYPH|nr:protein of unknown function [Candidatus Filomicrobium marinum]